MLEGVGPGWVWLLRGCGCWWMWLWLREAVGGVTVGRFDLRECGCEGAWLSGGVVVGGLTVEASGAVVLALLRGSSKSWIFKPHNLVLFTFFLSTTLTISSDPSCKHL